jgi:hypothetical protein
MIGSDSNEMNQSRFMKTSFWGLAATRLALWIGLVSGSAVTVAAVPVTFQLNMEIQTILGTFNAGAGHTVEVHGSFDGWGPGRTLVVNASNPNIYQGTIDVAGGAGSQVQYKFVINQSGAQVWEGNVGPGGAQNRSFNLPATAETLPVVYFNNQATPPGVVAVTFQINMSVQETLGNFIPTNGHAVEAHGSFDNWGAGIMLAANPNNASLYQGTVNISGSAGALFEHKFVINQGGGTLVWEGNVGPGGPNGNRTFTLGASPQILPAVYFNNLTNNPGAGIPVTFRLNMGVQIARGTFNPASGTVVVAGQFNSWSTTASPLTNTVDNPSLFVGTVNINSVPAGGSVAHKFVLNGGTWETGNDRVFTLESPSQMLPIEFFDRMPDLGPLSVVVVAPDPFRVTVSWTAGPRIRLQKTTNLNGVWEEVPGTLGQDSAFFDLTFEDERPSTFFRLVGP